MKIYLHTMMKYIMWSEATSNKKQNIKYAHIFPLSPQEFALQIEAATEVVIQKVSKAKIQNYFVLINYCPLNHLQ